MNPISDFPKFSQPRAVTRAPHDHFLANYFGIDAWSPDFRYLLALEPDIRDQLPERGYNMVHDPFEARTEKSAIYQIHHTADVPF